MQNWDIQLSTILNDTLKPMKFALFYNDNSTDDYQLIFSNMEKYEGSEYWDPYSIPSLIRVLTLKNQIVSETCLEGFYKEPTTEVCFVLEWSPKARKIMVFNTERAKVFEQEEFINAINSEQENLKKLYNRILHL
ncbi:MAG: hypothetical protein CME70_15665 [Halobacteriovorax sp.]|nr:hypothetical protein [Halobacteriovorax sp.]|tara:strand:+ start:290 stop:694 length:405 start_codon:yes stop_codon:yes gene_type:complete